jgi:hypothetical protein
MDIDSFTRISKSLKKSLQVCVGVAVGDKVMDEG